MPKAAVANMIKLALRVWIEVEFPPERPGMYLAWLPRTAECHVCHYGPGKNWVVNGDEDVDPSHWMFVPLPPEGGLSVAAERLRGEPERRQPSPESQDLEARGVEEATWQSGGDADRGRDLDQSIWPLR